MIACNQGEGDKMELSHPEKSHLRMYEINHSTKSTMSTSRVSIIILSSLFITYAIYKALTSSGLVNEDDIFHLGQMRGGLHYYQSDDDNEYSDNNSHDSKHSTISSSSNSNKAGDSSYSVIDSSGEDKVVLSTKERYKSNNSNSNGNSNSDDDEEEDEDDANFESVLPRTDLSLEYNDIYNQNEKYLMYSPSGGWSNQLVCMESALQIGRILNRTVLIPMAARHTNGWGNYNRLEMDSLFPMDRLLDMEHMKKLHPVIPLNITVDEMRKYMLHSFPKPYLHTIRDDDKLDKYTIDDVKKWNSIQAKFLFITGKGMYHRWFATPIYVQIRSYIRYAKYIRDFALKTTEQFLGGVGKYNAIHIRRGDYMRAGYTSEADTWASKLVGFHFKRNMTLYIATEPTSDRQWFRPITKIYKDTMFSHDLPKDIVHSFKRLFPPKTRSDFLGLLEQLICVLAKRFLGSYYSTFSSTINFMRKKSAVVFPEIVSLIDSDSDVETKDEDHPSDGKDSENEEDGDN